MKYTDYKELLKTKWAPLILKPIIEYFSQILPSQKRDQPALKEFEKVI
jgi:hypothetical protein